MSLIRKLQELWRVMNLPDELISPKASPQPKMIIKWADSQTPINSQQSTVPQPSSATQIGGAAGRQLAVGPYQGKSTTPVPLPPQNIQDLLWEYMPKEATQSAVTLAGENAEWKPNAMNYNKDGSIDYGLTQINNRTLNEMLGKPQYGDRLRAYGINKPEDLLGDVLKAIQAMSLAREYESAPRWWGDTKGSDPWSRWYGWQNKGYNIDPSRPIEEVARAPGYKQLRLFLRGNPDRVEVGR